MTKNTEILNHAQQVLPSGEVTKTFWLYKRRL